MEPFIGNLHEEGQKLILHTKDRNTMKLLNFEHFVSPENPELGSWSYSLQSYSYKLCAI